MPNPAAEIAAPAMEELGAWNLYHGLNLEDSFGDYAEAVAYLKEEQFKQVQGDSK